MTRLRAFCLSGILCLASSSLFAGGLLNLKDIVRGEFSQKRMTAVRPMADGVTYSQISADGKQIVCYSFRTGMQEPRDDPRRAGGVLRRGAESPAARRGRNRAPRP